MELVGFMFRKKRGENILSGIMNGVIIMNNIMVLLAIYQIIKKTGTNLCNNN